MTWVRIDDGMLEHPKVMRLSDAALRVHLAAMCYAARNLTDGVLERPIVKSYGWMKRVPELVAVRVWDVHPEGWAIHDYLVYNRSREQVLAERAAWVSRQRKWRDKDVSHGVTTPVTTPVSHGVPVPVPVPMIPTESFEREIAREPAKFPTGIPEHTPEERTRLVAMHAAFSDQIGGYPGQWDGLNIIQRGATETDIAYAISQTLANAKGRRKWPYFEACVGSRVEEREAGNDPDAGRGSGGAVRGGSAGAGPRGQRRGSNGYGGGGSVPFAVPERPSDLPVYPERVGTID